MLRKACTCLTAVLVLLACVGGASAQGRRPKARKVRVAILPVQVKGLSPRKAKELGAVVMKELRDIGVFRVVPGKVTWNKLKRLKKKKVFTSNCTQNKRCIRAVGRALRAKVIYFMSVTREEGGVNVSMRTFDVKSGKEVRESSELASEEGADLERATRWAARMVSSPMITTMAKGKGKLQINCEEAEAELYLNGKNFGKRTGKSFKVSSGVFDIQVKLEGYETFHDVVVVRPSQTKVVDAELELSGETRPVEVAAVTPEEAPGGEPEVKKGKQPDLPPWAVFEKKEPKAQKTGEKTEGAGEGDQQKAAGGTMPWQQISKSKAYLPDQEKEPVPLKKRETRFYETWWFWTVTAVVVAGAGGTAAWYFLLREEETSGYGAATITWQ
jgi:hypothetical protein